MAARPRPSAASDRLVVILSLVPFLLERTVVSVAEAAAHFDLPEEQIRAAVELIATSGLPGSEAAYLPNDLFDIDWDSFLDDDVIVISNHVAIEDTPRFSAREAAALIAGLQYLSALPENAGRANLAALRAKLTEGASAEPTRLAVEENEADASIALIRTAVERGRRLEFDYLNGQGQHSRREVDPLRVLSDGPDWYLEAYCHTREDIRHFRLDRMTGLELSELPVLDHADRPRSDRLFQPSDTDLRVVVDVAPGALPLILDYLADSTQEPVGDRTRVALRVAHSHGLKRLVAGLPGLVTVVEPPEAREIVAAWVSAALDRYR